MNEIYFSMGAQVATVVSVVVALAVLKHSMKTLKEVRKSQEFNMVNSILNDLNLIEDGVPDLFILHNDKNNKELSKVAFSQLLSKIFNKLDWLSFLINHDQIENLEIKEYVYPIIREHYEKTFTELANEDMKKASEYKEFKKLYKKLTKTHWYSRT